MEDLATIASRAIFVDNLALNFLLGVCTFIAVSQRVSTAIGLGMAVIAVQTVTVPLNNLIYRYLLAPEALRWAGVTGLDLTFLRFIVFIG
ncbi:MAG TPA: Rnf-Nqr domain containing protein, partial [Gammaproteobacteria bacterium]